MPVEDVTLQSLNSIHNTDEKIGAFNELIDKAVNRKDNKKPDVRGMISIVRFVVNNIGQNETAVSKPVLGYAAQEIAEITVDWNDELTAIVTDCVDIVREKKSYFAGPLINMTRVLAELHQAEDEYRKAGRVMASVDTEDQHFAAAMTFVERTKWRITTARYFLQDEDNTAATTHIQKSRKLLREVPLGHPDRQGLVLEHKTCYSRILDSERKFLAAAVNYMELSQINSPLIQESDLMQSLENAVTCAILAPAGGNRTRVLAMLYRDDRARNLKNFRILEKMHLNMLLPKKEQDAFAATLSDHHQATLAGGLTVLQKAVYEHNMLAASQIYSNIKIAQLAQLLGVSKTQTEDLARIMIQEGRMNASIDQVEEIIEFGNQSGSVLLSWDNKIQEVCMTINDIIDQIDMAYPNQFVIP